MLVAIPGGDFVVPQADGVTWYSGDLPEGYGLVVNLPGGSKIFFDYDAGRSVVLTRSPSDSVLLGALVDSIRGFPRPVDPADADGAQP